jgi:archaea-specific DNA-binding protein
MSPDEAKPQQPAQPVAQNQPPRGNQPRPQGERRPGERPQGDRRGDGGGNRPPQGERRREGPRPPRNPQDRNTVFIGNKPPMNYVLAVVTQFNGGSEECVIKARGKAISQAVDVAEIVRNKFFPKASVKNVSIGTENVTGDDGRKRAISAIEIRLTQAQQAGAGTEATKPPLPQANAPGTAPQEPKMPAKSSGV